MGDMGDAFREHKEYMRERKAREGIDCPGCQKVQPKRIPSRLLPGWTCKVCGYRRPNTRNQGFAPQEETNA
jgi:ribosomal protein L37AE/L43A